MADTTRVVIQVRPNGVGPPWWPYDIVNDTIQFRWMTMITQTHPVGDLSLSGWTSDYDETQATTWSHVEHLLDWWLEDQGDRGNAWPWAFQLIRLPRSAA